MSVASNSNTLSSDKKCDYDMSSSVELVVVILYVYNGTLYLTSVLNSVEEHFYTPLKLSFGCMCERCECEREK